MDCGYVSPFVNEIGKQIIFYASANPLPADERAKYQNLVDTLPPRPDCGISINQWAAVYPNVAFLGVMIGMRDLTVASSTEVLVPYESFNMEQVPWEKLNPRKCV
ncbi:hypothetical protein Roomu2_00135 [Pseudomonas phage vB_PpuM-Roomu-2]|uniref:Uncharacterized protein n=1 Tax=Pseudomonas phage vB_PpuM-Roomu-2 TaxID=3132621 RepID=A0AAX4N002_9CAUD